MTLMYNDLVDLFTKGNGIEDQTLKFYTVTAFAHTPQPKGIFIPLYEDSGELLEAIEHGAIAALWDEKVPVPSYTPHYFYLFYTNDLWKGLKNMLEFYRYKLVTSEKIDKNERTKFHFLTENSLNKKENTYDIAVMAKELERFIQGKNERRGE